MNELWLLLLGYMFYANKYIMFDGKVKGKEYNIFNDELLYEGEFLNDKRNGIGKEYSNGRIVYEGEFLNGKRSGKGKNILMVKLYMMENI